MDGSDGSLPKVSLQNRSDTAVSDELLSEALSEALAIVIAQQAEEWGREHRVMTAEARSLVGQGVVVVAETRNQVTEQLVMASGTEDGWRR